MTPRRTGTRAQDDMWERACIAARTRDDEDLLTVNACGIRPMGRRLRPFGHGRVETSVLIDADEKIFIDRGIAGQVTLQPPVGGRPFKLWVHTHLGSLSITDTNSLSLGTGILESAMVLGQPGPKHSSNRSLIEVDDDSMLSEQGPLSQWTDEEPVPWTEWYGLNDIDVEVME